MIQGLDLFGSFDYDLSQIIILANEIANKDTITIGINLKTSVLINS